MIFSSKIPESWIREKLSGTDPGHDWWHAVRVRNNALKIAQKEGGNIEVIETAALVHDLVDEKFFDPEHSQKEIEAQLNLVKMPKKDIEHVLNIIASLSFSKEMEGASVDSREFRIVQDADRLDAIGAIGIARAFSYGGHKGRELYNPNVPFTEKRSKHHYRNNPEPTINHFYEKLLRLKDMMKTATGRHMAEKRHAFMIKYLDRFFDEWGK